MLDDRKAEERLASNLSKIGGSASLPQKLRADRFDCREAPLVAGRLRRS